MHLYTSNLKLKSILHGLSQAVQTMCACVFFILENKQKKFKKKTEKNKSLMIIEISVKIQLQIEIQIQTQDTILT